MASYINEKDLDILADYVVDSLVKEAGLLDSVGKILTSASTSIIGRIGKGKVGRGLSRAGETASGVESSYMKGINTAGEQGAGVLGQLGSGVVNVAKDHPLTFVGTTLGGSAILNRVLKNREKKKEQSTEYPMYTYADLNQDELEILADDLQKEAEDVPMVADGITAGVIDHLVKGARDRSVATTQEGQREALKQRILAARAEQDGDIKVIEDRLASYRNSMLDGIDFEKLSYRVKPNMYEAKKEENSTTKAIGVGAVAGAVGGALLSRKLINRSLLKDTARFRGRASEVKDIGNSIEKAFRSEHATPEDVLTSFNNIGKPHLRKARIQDFEDVKADIKARASSYRKVRDRSNLNPSQDLHKVVDSMAVDNDVPEVAIKHLRDYIDFNFR